MSIQFRCPVCKTGYTVNDRNAGQQVKCSTCGHPLQVPGGDRPKKAEPEKVATPPPDQRPQRLIPEYRPRREHTRSRLPVQDFVVVAGSVVIAGLTALAIGAVGMEVEGMQPGQVIAIQRGVWSGGQVFQVCRVFGGFCFLAAIPLLIVAAIGRRPFGVWRILAIMAPLGLIVVAAAAFLAPWYFANDYIDRKGPFVHIDGLGYFKLGTEPK